MGWGGGGDLLNHLFHRQETKTKAKMSCFSSKTLLIRSCLITTRTSSYFRSLDSFRLLAVGRASRLRLRAGDAPNSSGTRGNRTLSDVPRDGNSGEDVVFPMPHLHRSSLSVSRHILRSPRVPASSAAGTRAVCANGTRGDQLSELYLVILMRQETEAAGKMVYKQSCDHHLLRTSPYFRLSAHLR